MWAALADAAICSGSLGTGWALARYFNAARVQVVPVPMDHVSDAVRFLGDRVDDVVRHMRMTGGTIEMSTSGHVTHKGIIVIFALRTLPIAMAGPEKDNRR